MRPTTSASTGQQGRRDDGDQPDPRLVPLDRALRIGRDARDVERKRRDRDDDLPPELARAERLGFGDSAEVAARGERHRHDERGHQQHPERERAVLEGRHLDGGDTGDPERDRLGRDVSRERGERSRPIGIGFLDDFLLLVRLLRRRQVRVGVDRLQSVILLDAPGDQQAGGSRAHRAPCFMGEPFVRDSQERGPTVAARPCRG